MAKAYTPGLKVTARATFRARRLLPIAGEVLVKEGDRVEADTIVAQTFMEGDITPLNVANLLSASPGDLPELMLKKEGDTVEEGEVIARSKGIFGMFKTECRASATGTIETISPVTGQMMIRGDSIPVRVRAYVPGTVVEVFPNEGCLVENDVTLIQGIFGIGGETSGPIRMACRAHEEELVPDLISPDMKGAIVVGGARMSAAAIRRAIEVGANAVISGGLDDQDLKEILGYDLGVAITGSERIGTTLVVTEGFGEIAMARRTFRLLSEREGRVASVNGATQIRAGVMRPEIVIPVEAGDLGEDAHEKEIEAGVLELGTSVRLIRDPHFGLIGAVAELPERPEVLGSGSKSRVLRVRLEDGAVVTVPRANVELIES